jgi:hypothetical protein
VQQTFRSRLGANGPLGGSRVTRECYAAIRFARVYARFGVLSFLAAIIAENCDNYDCLPSDSLGPRRDLLPVRPRSSL